MTKKSDARLRRDRIAGNTGKVEKQKQKEAKQHLQNNKCWDELNAMYDQMRQLLGKHAHLSVLAQNKPLIAAIVDKPTLAANIRILGNDLKVLSDELGRIHSFHADKKGGADDPDEFMSTIGIFEQYNLFMERHEAVVMPTVFHIVEQFDQAEKLLQAASRVDTSLKDPKVISDVEFTEVVSKRSGIEVTEADIVRVDNAAKPIPKPDFNKLAESFNEIHSTSLEDALKQDAKPSTEQVGDATKTEVQE